MEDRHVIQTNHSKWLVLKQLDRMATDLLLPTRCARCDVDLSNPGLIMLCQQCQNQLADSGPFCGGCGFSVSEGTAAAGACARCRQARFGFDSVIPMGPYRDVLRDAILEMKRPSGETLSVAVAQLLHRTRACQIDDFGADCLVPIPMYWGAANLARCQQSPTPGRGIVQATPYPMPGKSTDAKSQHPSAKGLRTY